MRLIASALLFFAAFSACRGANLAMRFLSVADMPYVQAALSDARVLRTLHELVSRRRYVLAGIERVPRPGNGERVAIRFYLQDPESASTDPDAQVDVVAEAVARRSGLEYEVLDVKSRRHRE